MLEILVKTPYLLKNHSGSSYLVPEYPFDNKPVDHSLKDFLNDVNDVLDKWKTPGNGCDVCCEVYCMYPRPEDYPALLTTETHLHESYEVINMEDRWQDFWDEYLTMSKNLQETEITDEAQNGHATLLTSKKAGSGIILNEPVLLRQRYQLKEVLMRKKYQSKYLAEDTGSNREVIVYELRPHEIYQENVTFLKDRFIDFIYLLIDFRPAYITRIVEYFSRNYNEYVVVNREQGANLRTLVKNGEMRLAEKDILQMGLQICDIIELLHYRPWPYSLGNLHLKNFILAGDGKIKLVELDFRNFFEGLRTIGSLFTNTASPDEDIRGLAKIIYSLLIRTEHIYPLREVDWPAPVSDDLRIFLELCIRGNKSCISDIGMFRKQLMQALQDSALQKVSNGGDHPKIEYFSSPAAIKNAVAWFQNLLQRRRHK